MDDTKHTANFLASYFLTSKNCLKPIYNLKAIHIAIIRYVCDSIDKNYSKRKKFENKIYQSQIAKYCFLSRKTINKEIQFLIKKRLLAYTKKNTFTVGKVLITCNRRLQGKDVSPMVTGARSVTQGYISNSSNSSNKTKTCPQKQKPLTNYIEKSTMSEEYKSFDISKKTGRKRP